ncbi:hypothetical protein DMB44_05420 [Thermoplasma sp. Kam2015]|uniref:TFIIB-type zinc ribbon-containing protein n=1 Tax=Thermoplasma sp. Kam2015 TaxID=2094122 RepID=UPI000D8AAE2B|nr:TFIIB-type zinc ribbon-containing protein [Thermoplasma sp. Kam2015]PYB68161.1 hypothetical protein DMB44_05420 [Thermoplasma sp. Kam2015]
MYVSGPEEQNVQRCPECGSTRIFYDSIRAEAVCSNCGAVISSQLDIAMSAVNRGQLWRTEDHYIGNSMTFFNNKRDALGKPLSHKAKYKYSRLKFLDSIYAGSANRRLGHVINDTYRLAKSIGLPDAVVREAILMYKRNSMNMTQNTSLFAKISATLYVALRNYGYAMPVREAYQLFGLNRRIYRSIFNKTIKMYAKTSGNLNYTAAHPREYVVYAASLLSMDHSARSTALRFVEIKDYIKSGSPASLAGAAVYIAARKAGLHISQNEIARIVGASESSIRNQSKRLVAIVGV